MRIQREREVVRFIITQERLGADLTSYPIPEGFERKEAAMGKGKREAVAWTQSYGYQTTKLRQIRAALVNGGPNIQVSPSVPPLPFSFPSSSFPHSLFRSLPSPPSLYFSAGALVDGGRNIQVATPSALLWRQPCGAHALQQGHSHTTHETHQTLARKL